MAKALIGKIIKKSGDQTISVLVNRKVRHPKYGKQMTKSNKILVHDPENKGIVGEDISFTTCRPISKSKHYVVADEVKTKVKEQV